MKLTYVDSPKLGAHFMLCSPLQKIGLISHSLAPPTRVVPVCVVVSKLQDIPALPVSTKHRNSPIVSVKSHTQSVTPLWNDNVFTADAVASCIYANLSTSLCTVLLREQARHVDIRPVTELSHSDSCSYI